MTNNICNDPAYLNLLDQKKRMQLFNIPPVRYNSFDLNPYTKYNLNTGLLFTKFDLDMRRKAEILQYNSNRMSTQTNNDTKSQYFSRVVSRKRNAIYDVSQCPVVKLPSSASGVPGNLLLYNDPNVTLYNYKQSTSYGIIPQETDNNIWNYTKPINIYSVDTYVTITTIYMVSVDSPRYTFKITTPIILNIRDTSVTSQPYVENKGVSIKITGVSLNVKYSSSDVTLTNNPNLRFLGVDYGIKDNINNNTVDISFNFNTTQIHSYDAYCYLGLLEIENLNLPVQTGYIYDIQLKIVSSVSFLSTNYTNNFQNYPHLSYLFNGSVSNMSYNTPTYSISGIPLPIPTTFPIINVDAK